MNRQIAIGLIVAVIIALSVGYYTRETKYLYYSSSKGRYTEITPERYTKIVKKENAKSIYKYNYMFIGLSFIGGLGLGYLIADLSKKKMYDRRQFNLRKPYSYL